MNHAMAWALAGVAQRMPRVVREHKVLRVAGWMRSEAPEEAAKLGDAVLAGAVGIMLPAARR